MDSAVMSIQDMYTPSKTPSKTRSFSDSAANTPTQLQPSPTFLERVSGQSKDDHALPSESIHGNPTTPKASRRNGMLSRGLSLQMPGRIDMPSPSHFPRPAPLSPQLDQHNIYMQQPRVSRHLLLRHYLDIHAGWILPERVRPYIIPH